MSATIHKQEINDINEAIERRSTLCRSLTFFWSIRISICANWKLLFRSFQHQMRFDNTVHAHEWLERFQCSPRPRDVLSRSSLQSKSILCRMRKKWERKINKLENELKKKYPNASKIRSHTCQLNVCCWTKLADRVLFENVVFYSLLSIASHSHVRFFVCLFFYFVFFFFIYFVASIVHTRVLWVRSVVVCVTCLMSITASHRFVWSHTILNIFFQCAHEARSS